MCAQICTDTHENLMFCKFIGKLFKYIHLQIILATIVYSNKIHGTNTVRKSNKWNHIQLLKVEKGQEEVKIIMAGTNYELAK